MARGGNVAGQRGLPALVAERTYAQVAARGGRAATLHSEATAMACRPNDGDQRDLSAVVT